MKDSASVPETKPPAKTGAIQMTGGEAIVRSLSANGVDTLFCIPGVELNAFFVALYDHREKFKVITNRHEQGCAYMALGYARSTGKVGAYAVVPGPGFLNSSAALSTAYAGSSPVFCVTGQVPSQQIGRGAGAHHEINNQLDILRNLTKYAARMEHPAEVPEVMDQAFRAIKSGRPRPVGVEMSPDMMAKLAPVSQLGAAVPPAPPEADPELIEQAAKLLGEAANPIIAIGGGIYGAEDVVLRLAEMTETPVMMSRNAKGAVSFRHHLGLPESAGHRLWADVDVVLSIGTRLNEVYKFWGVHKDVKVIRIDIDPMEIERNGKPTVGILADARQALSAIADRVGQYLRPRASRKEELNGLKARLAKDHESLTPQIDYVNAIRRELPDDGIVVSEATQIAYAARVAMPFYCPRTFLTAGYSGTLGFGFPTALGAKVANPDKQVVSISGDGGFLFGASELAAAVQNKIAAVTLVFNNNAYGNVKREQLEKFGGRVIASDLTNPDFVKLAEAYGAQGLRAKSPEELAVALRKGFSHDGPTVIEIPVGDLPSPWHLIDMPKVERKK
jgi:acetolactate synthase-1/2/3 large subunit